MAAMITELLLATWALPLFAAASDPSEWEVADLPGLQEPINFKHYSGYLNIANGGALHFWFMESQRSPSEDPVILWLSGGPGCSSLIAAVAEQGAFRVGYQGINMTVNPYSWNKVANIIFLESPVGVGFSYDLSDNYTTNDTKTTHDNYLAVLKFFDHFENFRQNDFYIMGESYAGVYVPLLVKRVLQDPHGINLKGYAIGNGAMDEQLIGNSIVFFAYYHGLVSNRLWKEVTTNCCNGSISEETCDFGWHNNNTACTNPVSEVNNIVLNSGLNVYNLYDPCSYDDPSNMTLAARYPKTTRQYASLQLLRKLLRIPFKEPGPATPQCVDQDRLQLYFNRNDVTSALHVEQCPVTWTPCNSDMTYNQQYPTMREVVQELAETGGLKALIYNGDVDMACNFLGDEWFVRSLGYEPTSEYRMWRVGSVIAGFVQEYEKNITFVTVKGSGHMVPLDKPQEALEMISKFLFDKPF
ncbi:lysosomal protective protein-like [Amblyomma americanum]